MHKYEVGLNRLYVFFLFIELFNIEEAIHSNLDSCCHLRPSDFSYFTISLRNHRKNYVTIPLMFYLLLIYRWYNG